MTTSVREKQILLVDSDEEFAQVIQQVLGATYGFHRVATLEAGLAALATHPPDAVLLNLDLSQCRATDLDCRAFLGILSERATAPPVIVYGWNTSRQTAMDAVQQGAADFLEQPLDIQELRFALLRASRHSTLVTDLMAAQNALAMPAVEGLLGNSRAMDKVNSIVRKVAPVFTSVLVTGESGTGKGVVARAIHRMSQRSNKPFIEFSICALPDSLIEDELFGHEKGAFTGAAQLRRGRFEEAHGGTIFLDEIGDLALPLQAKLLRVLQERTVERLGSHVPHAVDVRMICATNKNLEKMVQEGTFREDLYFRISVVRIHMPPLRERKDDIPLLAASFLKNFVKVHEKTIKGLTPGFVSALAMHHWPGNVRELQNVIERSLVLANGNPYLGVEDLQQQWNGFSTTDALMGGSLREAVLCLKRELVRAALRMHGGNKLQAARELDISRCYMHRLILQLNIEHEAREGIVQAEAPPKLKVAIPVAHINSGALSRRMA